MKLWIYGAFCLGGLLGCAQEHRQPADAGSCVNVPACECNDGRSGTKVCDIDNHELVMCECGPSRNAPTQDSGIAHVADAAHAGQASPAEAGRQAAGQGGASGGAGLSPSVPAAGASAADPVAGPANNGGKKGKGHNGRFK